MDRMIAFVFSGQGAQYSGMGKELYGRSPAARAVFDTCDAIRPGTSEMCFAGSEEALKETKNTQPCLFAVELAIAEALREAGIVADCAAGFSLGEIAALTYAGAVSLEGGFRLVCQRAALMQEAAEAVDTAMAAVVKLDAATVEALCAAHDGIYPVNYNCPGQITCAGLASSMAEFSAAVKAAGGRALPLKVKGGFHSPFMQSASEAFADVLRDAPLVSPTMPLYANKTAAPYDAADLDAMRATLAEQIASPVRWEETVRALDASGVTTYIEIGPGTTLSGLIAKTLPGAAVYQAETADAFEKTVAEAKK